MSQWDDYRSKKKIRIDLASIGLPGFWIVIKDPGAYTLPELDALADLTPQSGPRELRKALPHVILDWNITHPDRPEEILPLPSKDVKSLDVLPIDVYNEIGNKVNEAVGGGVPEGKGT